MRSCLFRAFAFIFGFGFMFAILTASNWVYPGVWLPISFAAAFTLAASLLPAVRTNPAFLPTVTTFWLGTVYLCLVTSSPFEFQEWRRKAELVKPCALICWSASWIWLIYSFAHLKPTLKKLWGWMLLLLILGWIIAYFSSSRGGADPMIEWFAQTFSVSEKKAEFLVVIIRKCVHFFFYGFVGWAATRTAYAASVTRKHAVWFALFLALCYAVFDEGRQTVSSGRGSSAWDVALDMVGAGAFIAVTRPKRARS